MIFYRKNRPFQLSQLCGSGQADDTNYGLIWVKLLSLLPKIMFPNIQEHLKGCSKKKHRLKRLEIFRRIIHSRCTSCCYTRMVSNVKGQSTML